LCSPQIAGFDFGCPNTQGQYTASLVQPPLKSQGFSDGIGQMEHFVSNDGLNVFRLPVCWQYLVGGKLGGTLDANALSIYDEYVRIFGCFSEHKRKVLTRNFYRLVGGCLSTGAYCVIDIHNYARWNNQIIGQSNGAVTNDQFANVWSQM